MKCKFKIWNNILFYRSDASEDDLGNPVYVKHKDPKYLKAKKEMEALEKQGK